MSNRIIKFRIWHNVLKKFLPQQADYNEVIAPLMDINGNFYSWSSQHWGTDNEIWEGNDLVLQQFTGLLDKNNKEIYEGDILLRDGNGGHGFDCNDKTELVEWIEANPNGQYDYSGWYTSTTLLSQWQFCEVIGNIFENPDLL